MSNFGLRANRVPSRWLVALVLLCLLRVSTADTALPNGAVARLGEHRFAHRSRLTNLAFTPDGTALFATARDEACLWNLATGRKQRALAAGSLMSGALSLDGRTIALAQNGSAIEIFDAATGQRRSQLIGAAARSDVIVLSPDGRQAASGDRGDVVLWDVNAAKELRRWRPPGERVAALQFTPDGRRLAVATKGTNGLARIENLVSGEAPVMLTGGIGFIPWLAFSPDGKMVAGSCDVPFVGGERSYLRIWNCATGKVICDVPGSFDAGVFSPDASWLVASGLGKVIVYDPVTGKVLHRLPRNQQHTWAVALTADGKTLAAAQDQRIRLWNTDTWQEIEPGSGHDEPVLAIAVVPNGRTIATGGLDGRLILWDWPAARERQRIENVGGGFGIRQLVFSPDGRTIGSAAWINSGDTFFLFDATTGAPVSRFGKEHQGSTLAFLADGKEVVTGQWGGSLEMWEAASGRWLRSVGRLGGGAGSLNSIDFVTPAPDGKSVWWASEYQGLGLRDLATGEDQRVFTGSLERAEACLAVSPGGDWLAAGGRVWDVKTKALIAQGNGSPTAISPDGRFLATTKYGGDGEVVIWEFQTRQVIHHLDSGDVKTLAFSPDGTALVTSAYTEALVWDLTGRLQGGRLEAARLSPAELESCWQTLAGADAWAANQAAWSLAAGGVPAVAFLADHLRPAAQPDPVQVGNFRSQFADTNYDVREHAARELLDLGLEVSTDECEALCRPERKYSSAAFSPGYYRGIPPQLGPPPVLLPLPERVRASRAVMALEHSSEPAAATELAKLADGLPTAPLTREARSALARVRQKVLRRFGLGQGDRGDQRGPLQLVSRRRRNEQISSSFP